MTSRVFSINANESDLAEVARKISASLLAKDPFCLWLQGPLGAGKTTVTGYVLRELGLSGKTPVTSPTYTYMNEYPVNKSWFAHLDLYRANASTRVLVWLHGGPTDQWQVTWMPRIAHWRSRGWNVLVPDHRGSTGHGRAYQQAMQGRLGALQAGNARCQKHKICEVYTPRLVEQMGPIVLPHAPS